MIAPAHVQAEEPGTSDAWQFSAALYLWGAGIDGKTQSGSRVSVDFGDIFDNLEMGFMGAFQARKGKWSLLTEGALPVSQEFFTTRRSLPSSF